MYGNRLTLQDLALIQCFSFFFFTRATTTVQTYTRTTTYYTYQVLRDVKLVGRFQVFKLSNRQKQRRGNLRVHGCNFINLTRLYDREQSVFLFEQ